MLCRVFHCMVSSYSISAEITSSLANQALTVGPPFPGLLLELHITSSHKSFKSHHNLTKVVHDDLCGIFLVFSGRDDKLLLEWNSASNDGPGYLNIVWAVAAARAACTPWWDFVKGDSKWSGHVSQPTCLVHQQKSQLVPSQILFFWLAHVLLQLPEWSCISP